MNNRKWIVVAVAALIVGVGLGYALTQMSSGRRTEGADRAPAEDGATEDRKVLYWHDPMAPGTRFDKPGKSPFMDMQLVPVYADEVDDGDVHISGNMAQNLGIRLGTVEKTVLTQQLSAVGGVTFDERLLEVVQARVSGSVTRLYVKAPLERVRRGQQLAEILSPEWLAAQHEYLALLEAKSESAIAIREAARQRLSVLGVPDATIRAIETDRKTNPTTTIAAPIDGVVTELAVREGSAFMAGAALFRINGLKTVWVNAQAPEAHVSLVAMGAKVTARATAWPGESFEGQVIALLPDVDPQTRTLTARVEVDNAKARLTPGMYVSLAFTGPEREPQLVIPSEAVIMTGERSVVIVARERDRYDVADVTVGAEADGKTTILAGLEEGQSVVLSGQFLIDSEASLGSAVNRLESVQQGSAAAADAEAADNAEAMPLAVGTIEAIDANQVTIAHGPVPSLDWPAMTMAFKLPIEDRAASLEVGDRVSFSFVKAEDGYRIFRIVVLEDEEPAAETEQEKPR